MGIDYMVCVVCEEGFPDVAGYGNCGTCEEVICDYCKEDMIKKYGYVEQNSAFARNYGGDNPAKCDSCENPTVTISKEVYERLLDRDYFLECLEASGVDNWGGYSYAREMYEEDDE